MNRRMAVAVGVLLLSSLAGCDLIQTMTLSAEEKINSAIPVSSAVLLGKATALELATDEQKSAIESEFNARLKLRALNCAKGYSPTWHTATKEIQQILDNKTCFAQFDRDLLRWIEFRKVGLILALPPLRTLTENAPVYITAGEFIQSASFAERAGVVLLQTVQNIELIDFENSRTLVSEPRISKQVGQISPNGRLFVVGEGGQLTIRNSESGDVVAEVDSVYPHQFFWIDEKTAGYSRKDGKVFLIDFNSGSEAQVGGTAGHLYRIEKMPDEGQYAIFKAGGIEVIELVRSISGPVLKTLSEVRTSAVWAANTSGATSDGAYNYSTNHDLTLLNKSDMSIENIPFEAFYLQSGITMPDADNILLSGFIQPPQGRGSDYFLYSISRKTLSHVDMTEFPVPRFLYIKSLGRLGYIENNKIRVLAELPAGEEMPMSEFISAALSISNQRKLEAFEKQQAMPAGIPALSFRSPTPGRSEWKNAQESGAVKLPSPLLPNLPADVQVEGVGIYQGKMPLYQSGGERKTGFVRVDVKRSKKPIVLVLSSYEPVRWAVHTTSGANLAAVLVSGYHQSQVEGAGTARVVMMGNAYAYQRGGQGYGNLNNETAKWTGKNIDIFQGSYEGSAFSVGGE